MMGIKKTPSILLIVLCLLLIVSSEQTKINLNLKNARKNSAAYQLTCNSDCFDKKVCCRFGYKFYCRDKCLIGEELLKK